MVRNIVMVRLTNAAKKTYCAKGEGSVDYSTETRWFKKFRLGSQKVDD